jgi:phage protein D
MSDLCSVNRELSKEMIAKALAEKEEEEMKKRILEEQRRRQEEKEREEREQKAEESRREALLVEICKQAIGDIEKEVLEEQTLITAKFEYRY